MDYQLVHDRPGRLRVRLGAYLLTKEQAYGIAKRLQRLPGVVTADVNVKNGGILIHYQGEVRDVILNNIAALDRKHLPTAQVQDADEIKALDESFQEKLVSHVLQHVIIKTLAPAPIRFLNTLRNAFRFMTEGWDHLKQGKIDVAVLDATSIGVSIATGYYATASSIMFLLHVTELLESYTQKKANLSLEKGLQLHIDTVWRVLDTGEEVLLPISRLDVGDVIRLRTGAMLPVDGTVVHGEALLNEASMTGEAMAVLRRDGHSVYAGTLVEEGSIAIRVSALPDNTRIRSIVAMIGTSEALKAGVQGQAERFADAVVPYSLLTSFVTLLLSNSIRKALSVLMVDYSCATRMSSPICIISAMREATTHHMMVKGGKHLEAFAQADTIVFDKTGTLTAACPTLAKVIPLQGYDRDTILRTAACIEEHFPHSVARAIVQRLPWKICTTKKNTPRWNTSLPMGLLPP